MANSRAWSEVALRIGLLCLESARKEDKWLESSERILG